MGAETPQTRGWLQPLFPAEPPALSSPQPGEGGKCCPGTPSPRTTHRRPQPSLQTINAPLPPVFFHTHPPWSFVLRKSRIRPALSMGVAYTPCPPGFTPQPIPPGCPPALGGGAGEGPGTRGAELGPGRPRPLAWLRPLPPSPLPGAETPEPPGCAAAMGQRSLPVVPEPPGAAEPPAGTGDAELPGCGAAAEPGPPEPAGYRPSAVPWRRDRSRCRRSPPLPAPRRCLPLPRAATAGPGRGGCVLSAPLPGNRDQD